MLGALIMSTSLTQVNRFKFKDYNFAIPLIALCSSVLLFMSRLFTERHFHERLWVQPGGDGRGEGAGDQWVKSGDWELGNHMIELCCFDSTLKLVKVCSKFDWRCILSLKLP